MVSQSKALLGTYLCAKFDGKLTVGKIVETEAYKAPEDKASHAYGNRLTNRTKIMFENGGKAYIYLCYGIHHLFNVVVGKEGLAHVILVRALEPVEGLNHMVERRNVEKSSFRLTNGPGILSKAMGITTAWNGASLLGGENIWIEQRDSSLRNSDIICSPRVGVEYAEECALWKWRFRMRNNPWCSPAT